MCVKVLISGQCFLSSNSSSQTLRRSLQGRGSGHCPPQITLVLQHRLRSKLSPRLQVLHSQRTHAPGVPSERAGASRPAPIGRRPAAPGAGEDQAAPSRGLLRPVGWSARPPVRESGPPASPSPWHPGCGSCCCCWGCPAAARPPASPRRPARRPGASVPGAAGARPLRLGDVQPRPGCRRGPRWGLQVCGRVRR